MHCQGKRLKPKFVFSLCMFPSSQALASNDCLKELSFHKSFIGDKGALAVCSTVKYLNHVEIFNLGECNLTSKGAEHVADMIKVDSKDILSYQLV